jgi:outer membrane protein assembly factor BamB
MAAFAVMVDLHPSETINEAPHSTGLGRYFINRPNPSVVQYLLGSRSCLFKAASTGDTARMTKRRSRLFLITLALGCAIAARAGSWPEFRGPTAQGNSGARNVPIEWSPVTNVVWRSAIGRGWSSPVISNGRIYLSSADPQGSDVSLRAVCLDQASGKILWDEEVMKAGQEAATQVHSKNGLASPTPIVRDSRLYVHFGHMGTAALDPSGQVLWTQTSIKYSPVHGNGGSPLLIDDLIVFSCDGGADPFLAALDAKTGEIRWKTPRNTPARNKFSFSTPLELTTGGKKMIVSPASGFVGGYSPKDGRELWRVRYGEGYSVVPRPLSGHGLLYVSSGFDRPVIYAIDLSKATGDSTDSAIKWQQPKGAPATPSFLLIGQEIYMVSDAGIASCLDALTGEVLWNERLGGNFSASPVTAEGRIYFLNEAGVTFVVRANSKIDLLARNELEERALASPALDDGAIFIRTESSLWRIGR